MDLPYQNPGQGILQIILEPFILILPRIFPNLHNFLL